ncbi:MAG TPA: hypothetical protein VMW79_02310, partial [Anaerolineae bacterium]|nr:hypothetical protein [Anaerolineae bacterium]
LAPQPCIPGRSQAQSNGAVAKVQHRHFDSERRDSGARLLLPAGFLLDGDLDWARWCSLGRGVPLATKEGPRRP